MPKPSDLSYILNHLGEERGHSSSPVAAPIHQTANFCFPNVESFRQAIADELTVPLYTRGNNPTAEIVRRKLAALEGTEDALLFSSGSAAVAATLIANLKAGDHVICVQKPYSWTYRLLTELLSRFGVDSTFVDGADTENIAAAATAKTRMIFLESPNSWTFEMQDLMAVAKFARSRGILTAIDNTWSSPLGARPASMGIDFVIHSASKYIGGHSDVVAGIVCTTAARVRELFFGPFMSLGACPSPHDAWLLLRGLRTLQIRVQRVGDTTRQVIAEAAKFARVRRVLHPHAAGFPQRELGLEQHPFCGGVFTLEIDAKLPGDVDRFANGLKRFLIAASWGGHESLVLPASLYYSPDGSPIGPTPSPLPFNYVRFAIGLEDPAELLADLEQALRL